MDSVDGKRWKAGVHGINEVKLLLRSFDRKLFSIKLEAVESREKLMISRIYNAQKYNKSMWNVFLVKTL